MSMVETAIPRAAEDFRPLELPFSLLRPVELQQRLPESVMREAYRPRPREAELLGLLHGGSGVGLCGLWVPQVAFQQRVQ